MAPKKLLQFIIIGFTSLLISVDSINAANCILQNPGAWNQQCVSPGCLGGQVEADPKCDSYGAADCTTKSVNCVSAGGYNCTGGSMSNYSCSPCASNCDYTSLSACQTYCGNQPKGKIGKPGDPYCDAGDGARTGVQTALGCIPNGNSGNSYQVKLSAFFAPIITWASGIGGLLAFGIMIYAAVLILTSQGDMKKVKAAQEMFIAAFSGLALIILVVVVFNFIGVKVLNLNLFGFNLSF